MAHLFQQTYLYININFTPQCCNGKSLCLQLYVIVLQLFYCHTFSSFQIFSLIYCSIGSSPHLIDNLILLIHFIHFYPSLFLFFRHYCLISISKYNNMNLPSIIPRNLESKTQQNKIKRLPQSFNVIQGKLGIGEQFGFGIQIFKIQSQKSVFSTEDKKNKNDLKQIVNSTKQSIQRNNIILPALDREVQQKTLTEAIKSRKSMLKNPYNNIKLVKPCTSIADPIAVITKPIVSQLNNLSVKSTKLSQTQKPISFNIFFHHNLPLNQIISFYLKFQTQKREEKYRQKEKKRKTKVNDLNGQKVNKFQLMEQQYDQINEILKRQQFCGFQIDDPYEEYDINDYDVKHGFQVWGYENISKSK